ncbi:MAG: hypothetical protein A3H42_06055 [Deltaproteobacteria bacterium RIFCSPLOWO2_02_FULL_46_8]|nr:MAG: hypothetical protein A3H42_06055 [Deltaproteobacteria bacterium RIFCSPLOWO2_02_FULL_46_8]
MASGKIQSNVGLTRAVWDYKEGRFEEAAKEAEEASRELETPFDKALLLLLAGRAKSFLCEKDPSSTHRDEAQALFQSVIENADRCKPQEFVPIKEEGGKVWGTDCASLQTSARFFEDRIKKMQPLVANPAEVKHTPDNFRSPLKLLLHGKGPSLFSPPLRGAQYIRERVFNFYDAEHNQWISRPSDLKIYRSEVKPAHHYNGRAIPRKTALFYYDSNDLFVLPVPDGFALDSKSVVVNGKKEGFDLLRDGDGIVYIRLHEVSVAISPDVSFDIGAKRAFALNPPRMETTADLIPEIKLPDALQKLKSQTHFYDAKKKYSAVRDFIFGELKYPEMRDVLRGSASLPRNSDGKEFYEKLSRMKLADCDVANSFGVVMLRKLGIPARLVAGLYADESGGGGHGWLEYWDDNSKEWVRGDMTPLSDMDPRQRADPQQRKDEVKKGEEGFVLPLQFVRTQPSFESWRGQSLDKFWSFTGYQPMISEPSGRYIAGHGENFETANIYDLETDRSFTMHLPPQFSEALLEGNLKLFETVDGPIFERERDNFTNPTMSLHSRFPPYSYDVQFERPLDVNSVVAHNEDSDGRQHLLVILDSKLYHVVLNPNFEKKQDILLRTEDLGEPLVSILPEGEDYVENDAKFSPDASHFALHTRRSDAEEVFVYRQGKEIYRYTFFSAQFSGAWLWGGIYYRINNDGSLDFKGIGGDKAEVWHVNPDGKEDPASRVSVKGSDIESIAWNGVWTGLFDNTYFSTKDGADSARRFRYGYREACWENENRVRCLEKQRHPDPLRVIVDPANGPDGSLFNIEDPIPNSYYFLRARRRFALWVGHDTHGRKIESIVNTSEDYETLQLKEMLKKLESEDAKLSPNKIRAPLSSLSKRPEAYLHYDWLLLGAAFLFNARASCANVRDSLMCANERGASDLFLQQSGAGLAKRLLPEMKASTHFPNAGLVSKAWSYLLAGALKGAGEKDRAAFLQRMISVDPSKAAEAILLGVENNLMDLADLPEISFAEEMMLQEGLRDGLALRKKHALQAIQETGTNTVFARQPFYQYQELEAEIADRFGLHALPPQIEKDW